MATRQDKAYCVSRFIETKNQISTLSKATEINMKKIYQKIHGDRDGTPTIDETFLQ